MFPYLDSPLSHDPDRLMSLANDYTIRHIGRHGSERFQGHRVAKQDRYCPTTIVRIGIEKNIAAGCTPATRKTAGRTITSTCIFALFVGSATAPLDR